MDHKWVCATTATDELYLLRSEFEKPTTVIRERPEHQDVFKIHDPDAAGLSDESKAELEKIVTSNILPRLAVATIRGCSVLELLRYIHIESGCRPPVMVVGGAIRDALLGDDINDIDLAIGMPYDMLEAHLIDFFAKKQQSLIPGVTLLNDKDRRGFGMLKVVCADVDDDHLDIGVFKSGYDGRGDPMYGFSPRDDAFQRDYTINAVYLDVFKGMVCMRMLSLACIRHL